MVNTSKAIEILGLIEESFEELKRELAFNTFRGGPARNQGQIGFIAAEEALQRISQAICILYLQLLRWDALRRKLPVNNPLSLRVAQIKIDVAKLCKEIGYY